MENTEDDNSQIREEIPPQERAHNIDSVINNGNNDHPQWQLDIEVSNCPKCSKKFSFFNRRHHCRKCGKVYCSNCCNRFTSYLPMSFVVFPPSEGGGFLIRGRLMHARFRTCEDCYHETKMIKEAMGIISESESETGSVSGSDDSTAENIEHNAGTDTEQEHQNGIHRNLAKSFPNETTMEVSDSLVIDRLRPQDDDENNQCPVCASSLKHMSELEKEMHINQCLKEQEFGSPIENSTMKRATNRMLVSYLPQDGLPLLVNDDNECVICLEEFKHGDKVGRLECLCCFHYQCIKDWINKKGYVECPVHSVHI